MLLKVGPGPETERHPLSSLRNEPQVASREGRKAAAVSPKPPKWHALGGRRCSTSQLSALANPGPCIPGRLAAGSAVLPAAHRMEPLRSSCRLPHVRDAQNTKTWRDARRRLRFAPLNAHFANTALSRVLVEEAEKREVLYIYVKKEKGSYLKKKKKSAIGRPGAVFQNSTAQGTDLMGPISPCRLGAQNYSPPLSPVSLLPQIKQARLFSCRCRWEMVGAALQGSGRTSR